MTKDALKKVCKELKLYGTPHINDKIYLHYKGWRKIENLDEYTGLKVIWLEGNGFDKIEGLENQTLMRTLYLQENLIEKIEGLDAMTNLDSLNLSQNSVSKIENLSKLKNLNTLLLGNNRLSSLESVEGVLECPTIGTLDIQKNKIDDPAIVDRILVKLPNLRCLYLLGNPVVKKIKYYRKTLIAKIPGLKYLDDRPVFDADRLRAEAFARGFAEGGKKAAQAAERAEIVRQREEKKMQDDRNHRLFQEMIDNAKKERAEEEAMKAAKEKAAKAMQKNGQGSGNFARLLSEASAEAESEVKDMSVKHFEVTDVDSLD